MLEFPKFERIPSKENREQKMLIELIKEAKIFSSPLSTPEQKQKALNEAIEKSQAFVVWASDLYVFEDFSTTVEDRINLLNLLSSARVEAARQEQMIVPTDDWESFLAYNVDNDDSALLSYVAEAVYAREFGNEMADVSLDHAKDFLLKAGRYVLEHPEEKSAIIYDAPIEVTYKGKGYLDFSKLLKDCGEENIWKVMNEKQIRGAWMDISDERDSDKEMRDQLAKEYLKESFPDARDELLEDVSEDKIVTKVSPKVIGIFAPEGGLETVATDDNPTPHQITEDTMFKFRPGMSEIEKEKQEQTIRDVNSAMDLRVRKIVEEVYKINLSELSLKEQVWFFSTMREISPSDEEGLVEFTNKFGINGARAFLSCEFGDEFRDTVLKIGERLDQENAELVFARYGEVVQAAQNVVSEIEDYLGSSAKEQLDPTKLEQKLLEKAKDFLVDVSAQDSKRLDDKLKSFTADVQLFGNIFRSLFKGKENPDLSMVKNVEVVSREAQEIDEKDKTAMLSIADKNWQEIPRMHDFVVGLLKKSVENPKEGSEFKIMKKDNDVLAFMRVDEGEDGSAHIGSVNVNPKYRGSAIGEVMLGQAVEQLAADRVVKLEAYPGSMITVAYCEKFGFVVDGVHEIPVGGEPPLYGFNMKRDDRANQKYMARAGEMTPDKLVELAEKPNEAKKIGLEIKRFDLRNAYDQMIQAVQKETQEGDVATRLFADPADPDSRLAVFEKAS